MPLTCGVTIYPSSECHPSCQAKISISLDLVSIRWKIINFISSGTIYIWVASCTLVQQLDAVVAWHEMIRYAKSA